MIEGFDPGMIANNLTPFEPTHPGEILKEELSERGISQKHFAEVVGVPYTALNEILNSKRPMSIDFCLRIEAALGIEADLFINLQNSYNTLIARKDRNLTKRLDAIRNMAASML